LASLLKQTDTLAAPAAALALLAFCAHAMAQPTSPPAAPSPYDRIDPGRLAGVWLVQNYRASSTYGPADRPIRTTEGTLPPMQRWAAELLKKRIAAGEAGHPFANTPTNCLPGGMPAMMFGGGTPIEIIPMRGEVVVLTEELDLFRHIYMNEPQARLDDLDPTYMGHSVGRWEGDTLVVDTIGTTDKTTADGGGIPHSEAQRVTERFHRSGDTMDVMITVDDPKTFTRPWTAKAVYRFMPGRRLDEYICDNNRNATVSGDAAGFREPK
jgi:hypothetical protein